MFKPYIVGIAGGSGSGKTYFARDLQRLLGDQNCTILYQDNYYIDQSHLFDVDGGTVNFDHPESLDFELMATGLRELKDGKEIEVPIYDFATHKRKSESLKFIPRKIILIDGILILDSKVVREALDESVFFDSGEELRYSRRLERDVKERGRTPEGVLAQFEKQVRPMHNMFVEPSKQYASTIVRDDGSYSKTIEYFVEKFKKL